MTSPSDSARRSDGERTHAAILQAAVRLASMDGLTGLTVGRLADELGISKSGLSLLFASLPDTLPKREQRRLVHVIRAAKYDLYRWG